MQISINLLPEELKLAENKKNKQSIVIKLAIGVMIVSLLVTAGILSQSLILKYQYDQTTKDLEEVKQQIQSLTQQEGYLISIKKRLGSIKTLSVSDAKFLAKYQFIFTLIPKSIDIESLTINEQPSVKFKGVAPSGDSFNELLTNLTDSDKHQNRVAKISIDTIVRNGELLAFDLNIILNDSF